MTFVEWVTQTVQNIRRKPWQGTKESLYQLYLGLWRRVGQLYNFGTPIYGEEWDILVVLDACRADLMSEVAAEYEFLDGRATNSVASTSSEWMYKNFDTKLYLESIRETAYITGNPFTDEVFFRHQCPACGAGRSRVAGEQCTDCGNDQTPERVADHEFPILEEIWRYAWDDALGTIPPEPLTDRAIDVWRDASPSRMIVHYMQPHHPFVGGDIDTHLDPEGFGEMGRESVWDLLRNDEVEGDDVWRDYVSNLQFVLDDVARLLKNVDADRVVITADHGNAMGEWFLYGHYNNVPLSAMKRVPWCVTTAENQECSDPDPIDRAIETEDVEERLSDLGYL